MVDLGERQLLAPLVALPTVGRDVDRLGSRGTPRPACPSSAGWHSPSVAAPPSGRSFARCRISCTRPMGCQGTFTHGLPSHPTHPSARADAISRLSGPRCSGSSRTYFPSDLERAARHQLAAPLTFILMAVTLSTGPVINRILSFRPANVLLVAPVPVGILRMLFPLGSKAITPCPLLI